MVNEKDSEPTEILDCIGLYCPEPLFLTRSKIDQLKVGEVLEVFADDPAAEEDLKRFCKRTGQELLKFEKLTDGLHFLIKRMK
jgi:tRNA 2-thiouridine synthesizing protein A